ncbi:hypothetical protein [Paenibacillus glufosinatiresistens]|uniref:hypothetical protein n=1 Tax=Paenibacillus glufosinatiresistens TaxID=3070657 RepID=UPI00286E16E7|nr:hypothetical protein [Paenibacillus sp. YX.27]
MNNKLRSTEGQFLFNLDILINAKTNPLALQYLLELLNGSEYVTDFKINSNLQLGRTIDELLQNAKRNLSQGKAGAADAAAAEPAKPSTAAKTSAEAKPSVEAKAPPAARPEAGRGAAAAPRTGGEAHPFGPIYIQIREFIRKNQLIRIRANRYGKQLSIPCRVLNLDEATNTINVYHVDEKQVYTFKLNEIDEFM